MRVVHPARRCDGERGAALGGPGTRSRLLGLVSGGSAVRGGAARHGDWGRDLVWYLGGQHRALTLRELGVRGGGARYAGVAMAIRRFGRRLKRDRQLRRLQQRAERQLLHVQT